jgi:hypothetical protein
MTTKKEFRRTQKNKLINQAKREVPVSELLGRFERTVSV